MQSIEPREVGTGGGRDRELSTGEPRMIETSSPLLKTHGPYSASFRPGSHSLPHEGIFQTN